MLSLRYERHQFQLASGACITKVTETSYTDFSFDTELIERASYDGKNADSQTTITEILPDDYSVFGAAGQRIRVASDFRDIASLRASLAPGAYFVAFRENGRVLTHKIIVP